MTAKMGVAADTQLHPALIEDYAAGLVDGDTWSWSCNFPMLRRRNGRVWEAPCGTQTQGGWPGYLAHWHTVHARPGDPTPVRPK